VTFEAVNTVFVFAEDEDAPGPAAETAAGPAAGLEADSAADSAADPAADRKAKVAQFVQSAFSQVLNSAAAAHAAEPAAADATGGAAVPPANDPGVPSPRRACCSLSAHQLLQRFRRTVGYAGGHIAQASSSQSKFTCTKPRRQGFFPQLAVPMAYRCYAPNLQQASDHPSQSAGNDDQATDQAGDQAAGQATEPDSQVADGARFSTADCCVSWSQPTMRGGWGVSLALACDTR